MGSITGAPKVRAMEIIAGLEPTRRGAYCGAMGDIGFAPASVEGAVVFSFRPLLSGAGYRGMVAKPMVN